MVAITHRRRVDILFHDDSNSTARFGILGLASEGASASLSLDAGNSSTYIPRYPNRTSTSSTGISTNGAVRDRTAVRCGGGGSARKVKVITVMFPSPVTPRVTYSVNDWVRAEKRRTSTKSTDLANPGRGRGSHRFRTLGGGGKPREK